MNESTASYGREAPTVALSYELEEPTPRKSVWKQPQFSLPVRSLLRELVGLKNIDVSREPPSWLLWIETFGKGGHWIAGCLNSFLMWRSGRSIAALWRDIWFEILIAVAAVGIAVTVVRL